MYNGQMEMSFNNARACGISSRRQRRISRARWWFERMRQVVERAADWQPAPAAPPEQTWLPGARHPNLESQAHQQVCE